MKKVFILLIVCVFFIGCAPQSVKKALDLADKAVLYAAAKNSQPELKKPLDDAVKLLEPVKMNVGYPDMPQVYDPGVSIDLLAEQAKMEQRIQNFIQGAFAKLTEKIPIIGEKIAEGIKPPKQDPFDFKKILAMITAVIAGYGGSKVTVAATKKVLNKG